MRRLVNRLVGAWRFWWGFCPACNSDAPEVDTCQVCRAGFRYRFDGAGKHDAERWQRFVDSNYETKKGDP